MSDKQGVLLGAMVLVIIKTDDGIETRLKVKGGIEVEEANSFWKGSKGYAVALCPDRAAAYEAPDEAWVLETQKLLEGTIKPPSGCALPKRKRD